MTTTATEQISAVSVLNMLSEIVDGHEDYVYDAAYWGDCVYFDDSGAPSCLVGHVLAAYGYTSSLVEGVPGTQGLSANASRITWVAQRFDLPFSPGAVTVLDEAQYAQDQRYSWGEAYARAARWYETMCESGTP